jgi:hypothetical protein
MKEHWITDTYTPVVLHRLMVVAVWACLIAIVVYDSYGYTSQSSASIFFGPCYFIVEGDSVSVYLFMGLAVLLMVPSVVYFIRPCCLVGILNLIATLLWLLLGIIGQGIRA